MGSKEMPSSISMVSVGDTISMRWITNLNTEIDNLAFELGGQHIWAKYKDHVTYKVSFVT
jgi:hypothetical protein